MENKSLKLTIASLALALVLVGGGIAGAANYQGNQAQHQAVEAAVEAGDYAAFQEAAGERAQEITEDQFKILQQAHDLREAGDNDAARELLESNDIPAPGPRGPRGGGDNGDFECPDRPEDGSRPDVRRGSFGGQQGRQGGNATQAPEQG